MNFQKAKSETVEGTPAAPQLLHKSRIREGRPYPLGATWDGLGVNFALFSANATKVELCLFDQEGKHELERVELPEYTTRSGTATCRTRALAPLTPTACTGPTSPRLATASIPTSSSLILTPSRSSGHIEWNPALFGYQMETTDDLTFDTRDSAPS
jgi:glycogen operon protein